MSQLIWQICSNLNLLFFICQKPLKQALNFFFANWMIILNLILLFPSTFFPIAILQNAHKNREMETQPVRTMSPLQSIFKIRTNNFLLSGYRSAQYITVSQKAERKLLYLVSIFSKLSIFYLVKLTFELPPFSTKRDARSDETRLRR